MALKSRQHSDKLFVFVAFFIGIDLLTTGSITWSIWPAGVFLFIYLLSTVGDDDRSSRELTIVKERFAKGEITEEEFLKQKDTLENGMQSSREPAFRYIGGAALILIGAFLILRNILDISIPMLPIILIAVGIFSIFRNMSK